MKMKLIFTFMALVLLPWAHGAWAQAPEWPEAIADNSFLVEEAYNQEPGVVQHVSTFFRQPGTAAGSDLSFSQEWPVRGQSHQLGYTLPYLLRDGGNGLGDLALHYRHQLRSDERGVALSPRVSLLLPAGRAGTRLAGVQVNLPVSRRWSAGLVTHANAGATHLVRDGAGGLRGYNLGASVVGLVHPRVNLLLEGVLAWAEANEGGRVVRERQLVVSPGLRGAIDVGTVQIVPGLAVPLTRDERGTHAGVFAYLSIEHPFEGPRRR